MLLYAEGADVTREKFYPLMLNIEDRSCVVVGGGSVAARKVAVLLKAGAFIKVISPEIHEELRALADQNKIIWEKRHFQPCDLQGASLAFACTNDAQVNAQIAQEGKTLKVWTNIATSVRESDFIVPSTIRKENMTIAISTHGKCPALARKMRETLETEIERKWEAYLGVLEFVRQELLKKIDAPDTRGQILNDIVSDENLLDRLLESDEAEISGYLNQMINFYGVQDGGNKTDDS